tara:strand:- start:650 stop:778 length:129 start_codon:yes stop_codon:yes gene_type:complete
MPFFLDWYLKKSLKISSFFYKEAVVEIRKGILEERITITTIS